MSSLTSSSTLDTVSDRAAGVLRVAGDVLDDLAGGAGSVVQAAASETGEIADRGADVLAAAAGATMSAVQRRGSRARLAVLVAVVAAVVGLIILKRRRDAEPSVDDTGYANAEVLRQAV